MDEPPNYKLHHPAAMKSFKELTKMENFNGLNIKVQVLPYSIQKTQKDLNKVLLIRKKMCGLLT